MAKLIKTEFEEIIMKEKDYRTPEQKFMAWALIVFGILLTLTLLGAIFGIPLIIMGIIMLKNKKSAPLFHWMRNQQLLREKLEKGAKRHRK